jgi:hypothetical protein
VGSLEVAVTVGTMVTLAALLRVNVTWPDSPAYMVRLQVSWEQVPGVLDDVSTAATLETERGSWTLAEVEPLRTV